MGYKYDERDLLEAAVELVLSEGFSLLTYGRLARRLGLKDRTLVYYFPTKADLVKRTVEALGLRVQVLLAEAFGGSEMSPTELVARAWPTVSSPEADPIFAAFLELVGLAAADREPYRSIAPVAFEEWVSWLTPLVAADDPRAGAQAAVAILDGLLLLRHASSPEAADMASVALFGRGSRR